MRRYWSAAAVAAAIAGAQLPQAAASAQAAPAQLPAANVALGEEIVRLGYPEHSRETMFGGLVDSIVAQMNQANETQLASAPTEVRTFVMERQQQMIAELKQIMGRHIPQIMGGLAKAYADGFTLEELTEIRNFVATPAGQAFLQKSADLMSNPHYIAVTQPYMNEVLAETQRWQSELVADLQARFGEPEAAE